jgi:hypothetical protein
MEHKAHLNSASLEGIRDRFSDQDLAQIANVDVAGGADSGYHHVRAFTVANQ